MYILPNTPAYDLFLDCTNKFSFNLRIAEFFFTDLNNPQTPKKYKPSDWVFLSSGELVLLKVLHNYWDGSGEVCQRDLMALDKINQYYVETMFL